MATWNLHKYAGALLEAKIWDSKKAEAYKTFCRDKGRVENTGARERISNPEVSREEFETECDKDEK